MIEVNNLVSIKINKKRLVDIGRTVINGETKEDKDLSIAFVGPKRIRELNNKYRGEDKATDVLSFSAAEDSFFKKKIFPTELGEIIICPAIVKKNAKEAKTAFSKELKRVLIHGILHLFGYDHEKGEKEKRAMERREERYFLK
ncbi:MAG: rRNA maturation RNase YbeY [bacterium]